MTDMNPPKPCMASELFIPCFVVHFTIHFVSYKMLIYHCAIFSIT